MSLGNPLWALLTTLHRALAIELPGSARRFPAEIAPFVGLAEPGPVEVADQVLFIGPGLQPYRNTGATGVQRVAGRQAPRRFAGLAWHAGC